MKIPKRYSSKKSREMGLGQLAHTDVTFVRKFRFTLEGSNLEDWSIKAVSLDLVKKTILITGYEVLSNGKEVPIEVWSEGLLEGKYPDEVLRLTTFDGCGKGLYDYVFEGLSVVGKTIDYDMSTSDETNQRVVIRFESYKRTLLSSVSDGKWFLNIDNGSSFEVEIDEEPKFKKDEAEINFLNDKMWLPGQPTSYQFNVRISGKDTCGIMSHINRRSGQLICFNKSKVIRSFNLEDIVPLGFDGVLLKLSCRIS